MWCTIYESIIIGIITLVVGYIILILTKKYKDDKDNKDDKKLYHIYIAFFMTGFILHIILEIFGFNKWYCDKKDKCSNIIYHLV